MRGRDGCMATAVSCDVLIALLSCKHLQTAFKVTSGLERGARHFSSVFGYAAPCPLSISRHKPCEQLQRWERSGGGMFGA